ncbi:hypothetical protein Gpo141_00012850 [Globisporangium polare]
MTAAVSHQPACLKSSANDSHTHDEQLNSNCRAITHAIPALHPRCLLPRHNLRASMPLMFLKKIERVEIASVEHFRDVTYYIVDVYLKHSTSRIPTNNVTFKPSSYSSSVHTRHKAQSTNSTPTVREPDFKIVRRFASFDQLRGQLAAYCSKEQIGLCSYCDRFRLFLLHCFTHPTVFVKLCASVAMRKKVLAHFLNRAIELAIGLESNGGRPPITSCLCAGYRAIPRLVDHFLRRDMSVIERSEVQHQQ